MKIFPFAFFAATLPLAVIALAAPAARTPVAPATQSQPSKPLRLSFVTNNASDYWALTRAGVRKAAQDYEVKVDFQQPGQGTAAEQAAIVDDVLSRGVAGMAISPVDPVNQTAMLNKIADKTLLFTQDTDAPSSDRVCYIGRNNIEAGRQAGAQLKRVLPAGGEVMVFVGNSSATNASERIRGLEAVLEGSNIRILDIVADDANRAQALDKVLSVMRRHPKLAACVGIWSYNGPVILQVLKQVKRVGKTKIVCFDEEDETLQGVARGQISATIVSQPYQIGYQSVALMTQYLRGDKSVVPIDNRVLIPNLVITKNNVEPFKTQLRQWYNSSAN